MKKMSPKAPPKMPAGMPKARMPKPPAGGMVMMANGGSVKKMSQMAGNSKSGSSTCGPGKASR